MKMFTKKDAEKLARNAAASDAARGADLYHWPVVKLFAPWGGATWLLSEMTEDGIGFGLADLGFGEPEMGYIEVEELQKVRGPFGLTIERDRHFKASKSLNDYAEAARQEGRIVA